MSVLQLSGLKLTLDETEESLTEKAACVLRLPRSDIISIGVVKKALDARRNRPPHFVYALKITLADHARLPEDLSEGMQLQPYQDEPVIEPSSKTASETLRVVVVGSGPAGLFAAYVLAVQGLSVTLIERGRPIEKRIKDVEMFWEEGLLNPQSNVLFGEGGAGTFSDGKLTSRGKNPYSGWVKSVLVEMGAPASILTDAKPHIGTDRLRKVLINLRQKLMELGCSIRFEAQVTNVIMRQGEVAAIIVNGQEEIKTERVILAIGQSADDTYQALNDCGVKMVPKPFAMGVRVEHPQALINEIQYGPWSGHLQLPTAEYFVTTAVRELDRSVYTFCMCPGGQVIGCSAFPGSVITNGMSNRQRGGEFANSAVVVNVRVADFASQGWPLGGLEFRKHWEQKAFELGGSNYYAPAQRLIDYMGKKQSGRVGRTSFLPGVKFAALSEVLPRFVTEALRIGLKQIDRRMPGFASEEAQLIGVETRTSSPVRICRGPDGQSENVKGLYPCGEGAGYAGGIISSALDGIRAAQNVITAACGCR